MSTSPAEQPTPGLVTFTQQGDRALDRLAADLVEHCDGSTASIADILDQVLSADIADRLPSQVSGGQLQRICIARALAPKPKLIILDEAVSNLDIHLQVSALALLSELQEKQGIAYLFVTHDLRLVERFADRVIVMEEGKIVEECATGEIERLSHPASRLLKDAVLPALPHKRSGCV